MEAFRIHLAGHPLFLTVALLATLWVARGILRKFGAREWKWSPVDRGLVVISLVALLSYAGVVVYYATDPHYFDDAEPTMTAVGWLFHKGHPIYHSLDSAERYAHIYGPIAFIAHGVALGVFGPSIAVSKWLGGTLALLSLVLTVAALRTHVSMWRAVVLTGIVALLMLAFRNYSFWTRAEPLMIFCVSAGLVAAVRARRFGAAVVLGLFAGLLWNLKATGPVHSLPLFVILHRRLGWRPAILAGAVAAAVAVLPFAALANVSFTNYVAWFRLSAENGLTWPLFTRNLEWAAYFLSPLLLAAYATPKGPKTHSADWSLLCWTVVATACLVAVAGSKPGAGPYHLLSILPVIALLVAQRLGHEEPDLNVPVVRLTIVSFVAVAAAIAFVQQVLFVGTMAGRRANTEIQDIQVFVEEHPGVVEMGYGHSGPATFERPVLVFRNNGYLIDAPAVQEHQLAGVAIPPATIDALRRCHVRYWLIPKDEEPFTGRNVYPSVAGQPLFPDEFRRVFTQMHTRIATTRYFDAWECRPPG